MNPITANRTPAIAAPTIPHAKPPSRCKNQVQKFMKAPWRTAPRGMGTATHSLATESPLIPRLLIELLADPAFPDEVGSNLPGSVVGERLLGAALDPRKHAG